jgi:hypothetical protein
MMFWIKSKDLINMESKALQFGHPYCHKLYRLTVWEAMGDMNKK